MNDARAGDSIENGMRAAFATGVAPMSSVLRVLQAKVNSKLGVHLPDARDEQHDSILKVSAESKSLRDSAGRYQVLGEIGRGGVGAVYKGHDVDLGRDVALKVLHEALAQQPEVLARFVEEAQIGGQLQHPGIVPVYELGLQNGERPFFAMKLVKGETLAEQLLRRKDASEDRRRLLGIFEQVCHTVAYAHARRVVHRDLKPANVMIGAFGEVQVVDWGFAKVLPKPGERAESPAQRTVDQSQVSVISTVRSETKGSSHSVAGSMMGTPAYMPPEQAIGDVEHMDQRSDVFGLGAILCEILTGRAVYRGEDGDLIQQAARADVGGAHARIEGSGADAGLIALCKQCLSPARQARPSSASEVAEQIGAYLTSVEDRAREAQIHAAEAKIKARSTTMLAAAALFIVVLGGGGYFVIARTAAARRVHASRLVAEAMTEASGRLGQARAGGLTELGLWDRAVGSAEQADRLGSADDVDTEQRSRARDQLAVARNERDAAQQVMTRRDRDAAMLQRLIEVRIPSDENVRAADWRVREPRRLDAAYAACFSAFLDDGEFLALDVDTATATLRASAISTELASGLDHWSAARRSLSSEPDPPDPRATERLTKIAGAIDHDDPWRNDLRNLLAENHADPGRLEQLARDVDFDRQPTTSAWRLGIALWNAGAKDAAIDFVRRAQLAHPSDFGLVFRLGLFSEALDEPRWSDAITSYRIALALRPDMKEVRHRLGMALDSDGARADALAVFQQLQVSDPRETHWLRHLGHLFEELKQWNEAIAIFTQATEIDPASAEFQVALGHALFGRGDVAEATTHFERAIVLDSKYAEAYSNLGVAQLHQRQLQDAITTLKKAREINPNAAEIWSNLSGALLQNGDTDEAIQCGVQAIALDPKLAQAYVNLGAALSTNDDLEQAIARFEQAIRLGPQDALAWTYLGGALLRNGDFDKAITTLEKAIALGEASANTDLGAAFLSKGRVEDAIEKENLAIASDPKNATAHNNMGLALKAQHHPQEAIESYHRAIGFDENYAPPHLNLGDALQSQGLLDEALNEFRHAHSLFSAKHDAFSVKWTPLSQERIDAVLKLIEQQESLLDVARGDRDASSVEEWLASAKYAQHSDEHLVAMRTFQRIFAAHGELADDIEHLYRYDAACCAALVGCGKCRDAKPLSERTRAEMRAQALSWSCADLLLWRAAIDIDAPHREQAIKQLEFMQQDTDFDGVRGEDALKLLPAEEAESWRSYWRDVAALIADHSK